MEKMIEGTKGSPAGWIASMHIFAFRLLADIRSDPTRWKVELGMIDEIFYGSIFGRDGVRR